MNVERWLQLGLGFVVALGAILLGMGFREPLLGVFAVLFVITAVWITDIKGWFVLNSFAANVASWIALAAVIFEIADRTDDSLLRGMSHLLVYLQIVLLFRHKTVRTYGLLLVASVLEVSVGAAVSLDFFFGALVLIYAFAALVTVGALQLYAQQLAAAMGSAIAVAIPFSASQRAWPLASAPSFARAPAMSAPSRVGRWGEFVSRVLFMIVLSVGVAVATFMLVPRLDQNNWRLPGRGTRSVVGFSTEVRLGEMGQISERPDRVMTVRLVDPQSQETVSLSSVPLFRGGELTYYDRGRWRTSRSDSPVSMLNLNSLSSQAQLVSQQISIEPLDNDVLPTLSPPIYASGSWAYNYDPKRDERIRRPSKSLHETYKCVVLTAGIRDGVQVSIFPAARQPTLQERVRLSQLPERAGGEALPNLSALARQTVESIPEANLLERARALERLLRDSGRWQYTLNMPTRATGIDPIEDFITAHPAGHCEYFASALALMLRSVRIPARVVVGFKGGNFNASNGTYEIQQLHAHAWVEAYLTPGSFPNVPSSRQFSRLMFEENGAWLQLDPTPAVDDAELANMSLFRMMWRQFSDRAQTFWADYVLGMDAARQQQSIYQPISQWLATMWLSFAKSESWRAAVAGAKRLFRPSEWSAVARDGVSWRSALIAIGLMVGGVWLLVSAVRRARRFWKHRHARGAARRAAAAQVLFYRRLERMLARYGLNRGVAQTPREFAVAVGGHLAEASTTQAALGIPRRLVDAFYRVRFGGATLDTDESQQVEQSLRELEESLAARRRGRS